MECWLKDFFKNASKWEVILAAIVAGVSIYVIFMPFVPILYEKNQRVYIPQQDKNKDIVIIYKEIKNLDDIIDVNCKAVLPIVYKNVLSLKNLSIKERKKKFIDIILPSILIANYQIQSIREKIKSIKDKLNKNIPLSEEEKKLLDVLIEKYKADSIDELLKRINTHKPSLIIAQAAIESGWGTSRFFVKANNIFGVWTFNKNLKSKIKAKDSNAYLKKYSNVLESIKDYYFSINVSWAYKNFRLVRLTTKDSLKLANYLDRYSILRGRYVKRIKRIIKHNNLQQYDSCKLHPSYVSK